MKKRILKILVVTLVLSLSLASLAFGVELTDLEGTEYKMEIEKLVETGIISGYTDLTFKPDNKITRSEIAKILAVSLELELDEEVGRKFTDVKDTWAEGYVGAMVNQGLMIGTSDTNFSPNKNITREELAVILVRAFDLEEIAEKVDIETLLLDHEDISAWAKKAVLLVEEIGLMEAIQTQEGMKFLSKEFGDRQLAAKLVYELLYNKDLYQEAIDGLELIVEDIEEKLEETEKTEEDKKDPADEKASMESIVEKYYSQLNSLQASAESQAASIIAQAEKDLEEGMTLGEIKDKYYPMALELEASTDSAVSAIISAMRTELAENGYPGDSADELYAEYEKFKLDFKGSF